jgi:molecular chaperone GrpE
MTERANDTPAAATQPAQAEGTAEALTLEQQLEAERARAAEYLENWRRSHADFINYRRRTDNERADMATFATAALLGKILPLLDDFDLALAHLPDEAKGSPWIEGITIIQRKLRRLLEQEGVTPIEALGQPFDPNIHEAVIKDDGASEPYVVMAELRKGYRLRDRVLRPTLVRVGNQQ